MYVFKTLIASQRGKQVIKKAKNASQLSKQEANPSVLTIPQTSTSLSLPLNFVA